MLSKTTKWGAYGLSLFLIGGAASALAVREHRYSGDWRLCSDVGAYHFDYQNRQMIFDDGIMADQAFEMQKCADNVSLNHCSMSVLNFVNPLRVSPDVVELDFSVQRSSGEVVATIPNNEEGRQAGVTRVKFDEDGSFLSLTAEQGGIPTTFRECEFPLFR